MKQLAKALAIATTYLDSRSNSPSEDDDVKVLEAVAVELQLATAEEKSAISSAFTDLGQNDMIEGLGLK